MAGAEEAAAEKDAPPPPPPPPPPPTDGRPDKGDLEALASEPWYYLSEDGEQQGPLEAEHLAEMCCDGYVSFDTPVYSKVINEWKQLEQVEGLVWMARHSTPATESPVWFALNGTGTQLGPLSATELGGLLGAGALTTESPVWSKVIGSWARMCDTPTLRAVWAEGA